jgi:hypothetical protein
MKSYANFDKYLAAQNPKKRAIVRAVRAFVKKHAPKLTEAVKWGNGCWVKGKAFVAYVYTGYDGYVQFGFVRGSSLKDPKGLLHGEARYVRHVKLFKVADLKEKAIVSLLKQAAR